MRILLLCICLFMTALSWGQFSDEDLIKGERQSYERRHQLGKAAGDPYDLVYHRINLVLNPSFRYIRGNVTTHFVPQEAGFTRLEFDLDSRMNVLGVQYHGSAISFGHNADVLSIDLPPLGQGVLDSIEITYDGDPSVNEQKGFSYDLHQTGPILWTLSEPYGAYGWWPCKQQLYDKIDSLDMELQVPNGNKAAGLGLLIGVDTLQDSSLIYRWKHRYPVATYLVAVAVTNYAEFTHYARLQNGDSVPILEYIYPEYLPQAEVLAPHTEDMMRLFDSLSGPYPFAREKYGHAQWGRGGGMEHQTMSFMSDLDFSLVAHELAHQWYGDKITCGSWRDIWLNEGFATYWTYLAYEWLKPQERLAYLEVHHTRATRENDGSVYSYDTSSVSRLFSGRLSYSKGAYVLHMLRWTLGDEAFFEAIRNYTADADLCYDFAHTADLQYYLEQRHGASLDSFFHRWVYQEGFPLLDMQWNRLGGGQLAIRIEQTTSHPSVPFYPLDIPFRAIGAEGQDTLIVLAHRMSEETLQASVGFEVQALEYDPERWLLARGNLSEGQHINRASVAVYPNPSSGAFRVFVQQQRIDRVRVFDALGHEVHVQEAEGKQNGAVELDPGLSRGWYVLRIEYGNERVHHPILIQ